MASPTRADDAMWALLQGGGQVVLVTHGSTIAAVTGINPDPAEMVVLTPHGTGRFHVAGRLTVP